MIRGIGLVLGALASLNSVAANLRDRLPQDEVIYFALPDRFENGDPRNDRGGLVGDRLQTGFDPTDKGFYHGGDLKGLIERLDYVEALGATAIWLGPIYQNKPVQGRPGDESAGYHGYWPTDFTRVDPHFGSQADMKAFVDAAHARGMKVYLDIITNHTADVIAYRECPDSSCVYRSRADFPYSTVGGPHGERINEGFLGDGVLTEDNFSKLVRADYAYTPFVPEGEHHRKVPAWLNDVTLYHNRGDTTFEGENMMMGDFFGLDDLMTENPRVVQGFIEIFGDWIDEFGIDGFRIDTARHVGPAFWQAFVPAMIARAEARGIPNFHIFGEYSTMELDVTSLARATHVDRMPSVLDFAFRVAVLETVAGNRGTSRLARLYAGDAVYEGGEDAALTLPTFISNHDAGRFGHFLRAALPNASESELLKRMILAHAMMFTMRGVPVIYYGDEQGFASDGSDKDAREDMFASRVASFNDNDLIGTDESTATSNFDERHPLFREIAKLARLRRDHEILRRGKQVVRHAQEEPGLFAVSRVSPNSDREILIVFNTSDRRVEANVEVSYRSGEFASLHGACAARPSAPGSYRVVVDGLSYVVCESQ